jgi:hypothetical protein
MQLSSLLVWCLVSTWQRQLQPASSFAIIAPASVSVTRKLGQPLTTTAAFRRNGLLDGRERNSRLSTRQQVLPVHLASSALDADAVATMAGMTSSLISTAEAAAATTTFEPSAAGQSPTTTWIVFIVGVIPFAWATVEFWRRIAVGASFGTGSDSVVISIGENDNPESSRGKQVLGKGALVIAYILFTIAAGILALVLFSVLTSGPLPAFESAQ